MPEIEVGPAERLFAPPSLVAPAVRLLRPTRPAIVLGSAQSLNEVVSRPAGVDVVRRRSGGGAVWLDDSVVWVDVIVPRWHPKWDDDSGRAANWIGEIWAGAAPGAVVHRGPMVQTRWARSVCFAGLGPGEVTVGGCKLVGISQRRTRDGALFQCGVLLGWDPEPLCTALGLPSDAARSLRRVAATTTAVAAELGVARLAEVLGYS